MPEAVGYDVTLASYCALALSKLEIQEEEPGAIEEALELVSLGYQNVKDLTWLSYAAAHRLIQTLLLKEECKQYRSLIAQIFPRLVKWAGSSRKSREGLDDCDSRSGPNVQEAIDNIKNYMTETDNSHLIPSETFVDGDMVCNRNSELPESIEGSTKDVGTVVLPDKSLPRRSSRASADSGYGSGEA